MNKQSNSYTIIYTIVLVLVVGLGLSLVYNALRPAQLDNIANDKKRQILAAALISPKDGENIADLYKAHIIDSYTVNYEGEQTDSPTPAFDINVEAQVKLPAAERILPVFVCRTDEGIKYILPAYGAGLWGPIWGYVAVNADGTTIYGAFFAHQGETPGLGAEIEKPAFSSKFEGKRLMHDGLFTPVSVIKTGQQPAPGSDAVQAISGATITSRGVQTMLENSLAPYAAFLNQLSETPTP